MNLMCFDTDGSGLAMEIGQRSVQKYDRYVDIHVDGWDRSLLLDAEDADAWASAVRAALDSGFALPVKEDPDDEDEPMAELHGWFIREEWEDDCEQLDESMFSVLWNPVLWNPDGTADAPLLWFRDDHGCCGLEDFDLAPDQARAFADALAAEGARVRSIMEDPDRKKVFDALDKAERAFQELMAKHGIATETA